MYVLIENDTQTVMSLQDIRKLNISFRDQPDLAVLGDLNIFPLVNGTEPQLLEFEQSVQNAIIFQDNQWTRTYTTVELSLEEAKEVKKQEVKKAQTQHFLSGWTYDFGAAGIHTLDLRDANDKANWTLLLIKTQGLIAAGFASAPTDIQTSADQTITVTASEAFAAMQTFLQWGEDVLKHKWTLDAQIDLCATLEDLRLIDETAEWPT